MTARTLQPSELEIQREVEALRDLRRRSITPGALTIDPDLPPNQSPPSPSQSYWSNNSQVRSSEDGDSSSSSHEGSSIPRRRSSRSAGSDSGDVPTAIDDPFHLFWVPASIHPEIAPAEFRAFLKEHARAPSSSDESGMTRSHSVSSYSSSSNLARRKSMLSRQYQPSEDDGVEDEKVVPIRRNRGNLHPNQGPQLTISDLQKLEQLAEEASTTDDPSKFRNILRRSLSLNISPAALPYMEEIPDLGDEADVPIIVPPPGQILRRAARTKIRKPSLTGDGGHLFKPTRRARARAATTPVEPRTSSDRSSSDHGGESLESVPPEHILILHDKVIQPRPDSYSDEALIIDAYSRDEEEESIPQKTTSPEPVIIDLQNSIISSSIPPQLPLPDVDAALFEAFEPSLFQSEPRPVSAQLPESQSQQEPLEPINIPLSILPPNAVTPSLVPLDPSLIPRQPPEQPPEPPQQPPPQPSAPISVATDTQPPQQRKEKDKKGGLFGKWGSDKSSKKLQKNASSEKEIGFFSSLFGGSKKKQEAELVSSIAGREAAQALLGTSKSKSNLPHNALGFPPGMPPNNYSRYPIHVERAIYRLSHIKLANPRRPLYEQVLISNLMFWYLGVINKAQTPAQPSGQPIVPAGASAAQSDDVEREQREKEQREKAEKERLEKEQREREAEARRKESGKRGSLTKAPAAGSPGGGRRAEMPIKGPQYEMQHRVMEQEYGYAGQGAQSASLGRINSTPAGAGESSQPERQRSSKSPSPPRMNSTSPTPSGRRSPTQNSQRLRYSPNSSQENLFAAATNGKLAGRSLSTTAIPSPPMYQVNGRARKGVSAYVAIPSGTKRPRSSEGRTDENGFEEEDVPLAVWQQQRKR